MTGSGRASGDKGLAGLGPGRARCLRWECSEHPAGGLTEGRLRADICHALEGLGRGQTVRKVGGGPESTVSPSRT